VKEKIEINNPLADQIACRFGLFPFSHFILFKKKDSNIIKKSKGGTCEYFEYIDGGEKNN
jgi:hypothetical protein